MTPHRNAENHIQYIYIYIKGFRLGVETGRFINSTLYSYSNLTVSFCWWPHFNFTLVEDTSKKTSHTQLFCADQRWMCNKTASFQKEAMRTQLASYFYEAKFVFFVRWVKKTSEQTRWESWVYCFKIVKKWLDLFAFVYKRRDKSLTTHHPSYRLVTSRGVKQSIVTWITKCLREWAVLFSLPGSVMGRETISLCYDFSEVLQSWWDRNANESRKRYLSTD